MKKQRSPAFKTVPVRDACGMTITHDMTEIVPEKSKEPAFKRGHRVQAGDICRLMRMGKKTVPGNGNWQAFITAGCAAIALPAGSPTAVLEKVFEQ